MNLLNCTHMFNVMRTKWAYILNIRNFSSFRFSNKKNWRKFIPYRNFIIKKKHETNTKFKKIYYVVIFDKAKLMEGFTILKFERCKVHCGIKLKIFNIYLHVNFVSPLQIFLAHKISTGYFEAPRGYVIYSPRV